MRCFELIRDIDHSGLSGTGVVAEGAQFTDGTVVLRWLDHSVSEANRTAGVRPTTVIHDSIGSVIALHGHGGATQLRWLVSDLELRQRPDGSSGELRMKPANQRPEHV